MLGVFLFVLLDASIKQTTDKTQNNISLGLDYYFQPGSMVLLWVPIVLVFVYLIYNLVIQNVKQYSKYSLVEVLG